MSTITRIIEKYFLVWVVLFSLCGYHFPSIFRPLVGYIPVFLGIIMFGMGITLQPADFLVVVKFPLALIAGVVAQFVIMPLVAWALCMFFNLPPLLAVGIMLVGTCPGGTASNVITYLSKGDVALSVAMTTASTLLSPALTPLLTYLYAGRWVSVPVASMFVSIVQVIIIPVGLGIMVRLLLQKYIDRVLTLLPSVSVMAIVTIIAGMHNVGGLALGYAASALLGFDQKVRRTIAIEVGMQNSGLAVSLAIVHFEAIAALPGAIFSIWHNISGSLVAWWWRR
jgi:BASS family bile acid:Na+ symporter